MKDRPSKLYNNIDGDPETFPLHKKTAKKKG